MTSIPHLPVCNNSRLEAALSCARRGWHVLPLHSVADGLCTCDDPNCRSPGKHPLTARGVLDATTNEATIRQWWTEAPAANLAIRTGPESNLFAVGPDGPAGIEALAELQRQHGELPATPRVITGGGGQHYYFQYPAGGEIQNRANHTGLPIDIRGRNGYVVAPPSGHCCGSDYSWIDGSAEAAVAAAPAWLLDWARRSSNGQPQRNNISVLVVVADDLATAPGVGEGQRHHELCRLVGHHLNRGQDAAEIEPLALAWAGRCDPPLPAVETRRVVADLGRLHLQAGAAQPSGSALGFGNANVEEEPLPPERPWPVLDQAALYGLAGDIVRRIEPETEADPVAVLIQFLVWFGCAVGRVAHMLVEADRHFANLFVVLVGMTSHGRKGTSAGRVRALFDHTVNEVRLAPPQVSGLSSGEGLIWAVRDAIVRPEPRKENGQVVRYDEVVADPGVIDKRLLVHESEFASVLRVVRRDGNTLSPTVRSAWDHGNLRTLTKTSPARATDAHISIIGHITQEELRRHLTEVEIANGFANRYLWVSVRRSKHLPEGGRPVVLEDLVERLAAAIDYARQLNGVERDRAATALWQEEYRRLSAGRCSMFGAVTGRAEAQVLRLSLIYALLDQSPVVCIEHLQAALAVWNYSQASAQYIFGDSTGDPTADAIRTLIRSTPGITRTEIHGHFSHHLPKTLVSTLAMLRDLGMIFSRTEATGGRPRERWYPAGHTFPGEEHPLPAELSAPCSSDSQSSGCDAGHEVAILSFPSSSSPSDHAPPTSAAPDDSPWDVVSLGVEDDTLISQSPLPLDEVPADNKGQEGGREVFEV